jgi:hypothetical protein
MSRVETEGVSFLTITLPAFGKDFELSLDQGQVTSSHFLGFKRVKGLPAFLAGFLTQIFDPYSGCILDTPDVDSIFAVRQLTLAFGKIHFECSEERSDGAVVGYLKTEDEVRVWSQEFLWEACNPSSRRSEFIRMSRLLFGNVFAKLDEDIYYNRIVPKHGPGATADRLRGNAKFDQLEWTSRLEEYFPYGDYSIPSWRYYYRLEEVDFIESGNERPVRVILVPKTLKTPRIIAIEPTCMQYMQQAIMETLVGYLECDSILGYLLGFTDQFPNQEMAMEGSRNGDLATLDLSEASDRVSNEHVRALFHRFPYLDGGVQVTRSLKAHVPSYHGRPEEVIELTKFASMGSALTFPVEAMTFLTVICLALEAFYAANIGRLFSPGDFRRIVGRVRVYGDDLIVPAESASLVIEYLNRYGFKVNRGKSFWTGKFRESCGKEYYDGSDVSITRVRQALPTSLADVSEIISTVSLRNQLYLAGLWKTADYLDTLLSGILAKGYPRVGPDSPVLGRLSFLGYDTEKIHPTLHSPLVKGYVVKSKPPLSTVSGEGALLKWFLKRGDEPFADRNHLERSGRPKSVVLRLGMASPF